MKAWIESDHCTKAVKVWLYREEHGGTVFMWPTHRDDYGNMVWTQELVAHDQMRPDTVKPALEMGGFMWEPFVAAIRDIDHDQPAGAVLYKTLEREQNRVDALIHALIKGMEPSYLITSTGEQKYGAGT